jgi:2-succinyl-5-enolpyruvyl-6-hydroxy-3-cyclohexene-1-carboxylate synthase
MKNLNFDSAMIFISQLVAQGLSDVCISPGSRSTPLVLAIYKFKDILKIHVIIDERASAFMALGISKVTQRPTVVVCTSGTAVANYYPAVLEAERNSIPLLILSADRPLYLRYSGSNQTFDQSKIFGDHVKAFVDVNLGSVEIGNEESIGEHNINYLESLAAKYYNLSVMTPEGPVHMNFPFDKPLEPELKYYNSFNPSTNTTLLRNLKKEIVNPMWEVSDLVITNLLTLFSNDTIVIIGPMDPMPSELTSTIEDVCALLNSPIISEPMSNIFSDNECFIAGHDTFLTDQTVFETLLLSNIVQIGSHPTSTQLLKLLNLSQGKKAHITSTGLWEDESYKLHLQIIGNYETIFTKLKDKMSKHKLKQHSYLDHLKELSKDYREFVNNSFLSKYSDASVLIKFLSKLSSGSFFVGNSLPVRHIDQFFINTKHHKFYGNRGLSGIDGNIAISAGLASLLSDLFVIIGDVTFLHDLNSLNLINTNLIKLKIIISNNSGGGVFKRLPIGKFDQVFTDLFVTNPKLNIAGIVESFGYKHYRVSSMKNIDEILQSFISDKKSAILEIQTNMDEDYKIINQFVTEFQKRMKSIL